MRFKSTKKIIFGTILFFFVLSIYILFYEYIKFETLIEYRAEIKNFSENNFLLTLLLFTVIIIIFNNLPVPILVVSQIFGGFLYGFYLGVLINMIATFISSMTGFYVSRYLFKEYFQKKYSSDLKTVNSEVEKYGFNYFLSLRLLLVVPYFLINIFGGISKISQKNFISSSIIGVIPSAVMYAYVGQQIDIIADPYELLSLKLFIVFSLISLIIVFPVILKHEFVQLKILKSKMIIKKAIEIIKK